MWNVKRDADRHATLLLFTLETPRDLEASMRALVSNLQFSNHGSRSTTLTRTALVVHAELSVVYRLLDKSSTEEALHLLLSNREAVSFHTRDRHTDPVLLQAAGDICGHCSQRFIGNLRFSRLHQVFRAEVERSETRDS
jgi:hypothetical protein